MILACNSISKSFGSTCVLKDISFHVNDREKVGIIGLNGAGKSTLLKIIMGEESMDEGQITLSKDASVGYLAQHQDLSSSRTLYEEILSVKADVLALWDRMHQAEESIAKTTGEEQGKALELYARLTHDFEQQNGYAAESEAQGVLRGLGFSPDSFGQSISTLSGGQKTRVFLGKLLLSRPDLILLDEPTNHLDLASVAWLESYLVTYPKAVVIVSHDRYFMDRVVTKIVEIEGGASRVYEGNYSEYAKKKAALREAELRLYLNQQQEIKHQEEVITKLKSFNREKSIKRAESREKLLSKVERIAPPPSESAPMRLSLDPGVESGKDVLEVTDLSKSFSGPPLFTHLHFQMKRGEKVALIGRNGTGKTTILKLVNRLLPADTGEIRLGSKVEIGYYDQEQQVLSMDKTLFQELQDCYPDLNHTRIRNVLAAFLFTGDDVFKRIGDLSGGEKGRVSLAKLMLSNANLLILDEPTNHLDIASKEILEDALNDYSGTVLYVSHDRYFINRTATRILDLTHGTLVPYLGNYDYYLEKKEETQQRLFGAGEETSPVASGESEAKADWKQQKEEQAKRRKKETRLAQIEQRIEELEQRDGVLDQELTSPEIYASYSEVGKRNQEKEEISREMEALLEEWDALEKEEL